MEKTVVSVLSGLCRHPFGALPTLCVLLSPPPPVPSVSAFPVSYPIQFFSPPQGGLLSVPMPLVPSPSVPHTTHAVFLLSSVPLTPSPPVPLRTRAPSVHTPQSPTPISHPISLIPPPHSVRCSLSPRPLSPYNTETVQTTLFIKNSSILLKNFSPDSF